MSQSPATGSSSPSTSTCNSWDPGYLYFWAHTQATYIFDRNSGVHYPEPNTYDEWLKADQVLRDQYSALEDSLRCDSVITNIFATTSKTCKHIDTRDKCPGNAKEEKDDEQTEDKQRIEVLGCALYENLQWERFKATVRVNGIKYTKQTESRVKQEARKRWATLEPTDCRRIACIRTAKEKEVFDAKMHTGHVYMDDATFNLGAELDWMDKLGLYK